MKFRKKKTMKNKFISFWKPLKIKPFLNLKSYPKRSKQETRLIDRNPFGDKDKDKIPNIFDCKPLNKKKQGFLESPKKKRNIEQVKRRIDELSMLVTQIETCLFTQKTDVLGQNDFGVNLEDLIFTFKKNEKAPDFVKGEMVINIDQLKDWCYGEGEQYLTEYKGEKQLKCQMLDYEGKISISVNTYKRKEN